MLHMARTSGCAFFGPSLNFQMKVIWNGALRGTYVRLKFFGLIVLTKDINSSDKG